MVFKVVLILFLLWHFASAYEILVALPTTLKSHYQFGNAIAKALAAKGHEVTVISPFKQPKPAPNYEEVYLELTEPAINACKNYPKKNMFLI